jgi:Glyoxalase-like domain
MADVTVVLTDIIVDCHDPENLAGFWSTLLQRPIEGRKGPYVWLAPSNGIGLGFQRVVGTKRGENRVHLDVSGADIPQIKARVEALGGKRVPGYERVAFS